MKNMKNTIFYMTLLCLLILVTSCAVLAEGDRDFDFASAAETTSPAGQLILNESTNQEGNDEDEDEDEDENEDSDDEENASSTTMSGSMMGSSSSAVAPTISLDNLDWADLEIATGSAEETAVRTAVAQPDIAHMLAQNPSWVVEVYEEEGVLAVEFFTADWEEWLGYVALDPSGKELYEVYAPQQLTAEQLQAGQTELLSFLDNNAEVQTVLGDPSQWEQYIEYEPYDQIWYVWYGRGLEELEVIIGSDSEIGWYIEEIYDPTAFTDEQALENSRNQAISLAYEADGIDTALEGVDDWKTLVSPHQGSPSQWAVSFVTGGQELFYALVDIESGQILESSKTGS